MILGTHIQERPKTAMIFGVTGQDGSYLSELLLEKDYDVVGVKRRSSVNTEERLHQVIDNPSFQLVEGDITDPSSVMTLINQWKPDECYNLAAMSHVGTSFEQPSTTFQIDAVGPLNILEAIRLNSPKTKMCQCSTSELFGSNYTEQNLTLGDIFKLGELKRIEDVEIPEPKRYQDENTPFAPNSPYAVAKMAAHDLVRVYRDSYDIFCCASIGFNHESCRRTETFVTRKITKWIGKFSNWCCLRDLRIHHSNISDCGTKIYNSEGESFPKLCLGNMSAQRDWGHAKDTVRGQYLMMQQEKPDDYVLATGEAHSVEDFVREAFNIIGIDNWSDYVYIDPKLYRPCDVEYLLGKADKAKRVLGWEPDIKFKQLVQEMVEYDINVSKRKKDQTLV